MGIKKGDIQLGLQQDNAGHAWPILKPEVQWWYRWERVDGALDSDGFWAFPYILAGKHPSQAQHTRCLRIGACSRP